jgi:hypothetical protein
MTFATSLRGAMAAAVSVAALAFGAGAASAATVTVTIDFGTVRGGVASPYVEDGFEIAGDFLFLGGESPDILMTLDSGTRLLTVTRSGGGTFSLVGFDYRCLTSFVDCVFSVTGGLAPFSASASAGDNSLITVRPTGFTDLDSLFFTLDTGVALIDNIVLRYEDPAVIPLPAGLPLLAAGLGALGLMARRRRKAA